MKRLISLLTVATLLMAALGTATVVSAADTSQTSENGFHYNKAGDPVMDFASEDDHAQIGTWWWWPDDAFNPAVRDKYLNFLEENGVNEIYFYGFYLLQNSGDRAKLHGFVQEANNRGMAISFLYDEEGIATVKDNRYLADAASDYLTYVSEYPKDKLDGLHFDVENKSLKQYLVNMIPQFADCRARGVPLAMDVNCSMDATAGELNGVTGIYNIIAANVDTLSLMSYRDTFGGIWSLGAKALKAAKAQGCRVVFGAETGAYSFNSPSDEFAQEDKEYMYGQLMQVYEALKEDPPAGGFGIAIHQHEDWYKLKKSDTPVTENTRATFPTKRQGELEHKTLWEGDVNQDVLIGKPTPYQGLLTGDVAAAINNAIQADIREHGTISGEEYYEITTVGSAHGSSGYATTGFVVGNYQIWTQDSFDGCGIIRKANATYTQRLMGNATDRLGRELLAEKMDETAQFAFFSDANGSVADVCQVKSLSISVYRYKPTVSLLGDANDDGEITMKDVLIMRKHVANMATKIQLLNADVNRDSAVNMKDVLLLRKYLAGLIKAFA